MSGNDFRLRSYRSHSTNDSDVRFQRDTEPINGTPCPCHAVSRKFCHEEDGPLSGLVYRAMIMSSSASIAVAIKNATIDTDTQLL